ncbi:MAG TPA: hypothetical protein P5531_10530 [Bacteroidales bacterium]|nr:hypothetical protein [Bacteroidales bacterium]HSA43602.1 hypothetical protein [Bacteroidales bacterium]
MASDFLLSDTGDVAVVKGDLVIAETFDQEVTLILQSYKGEFKQSPLLGPNLIRRIKSKSDSLSLKREVAISMEMDNKSLESLSIEDSSVLNISVK